MKWEEVHKVKKSLFKDNLEYLLSVVLSVVAALIIGVLIMLANGRNPSVGYKALLDGAFGSKYKMANTLAKTVPLVLTAFATAISFESGIFNIGGEGQLYLGAFAAAYIGFTFTQLPKGIGIALAIISSAIIGGLFALIPAILKVKYKIDEVITTIMLNSVAVLFTDYLVNYPFATTGQGKMVGTETIAEKYRFTRLVKLSTLNTSIFFMIGISIIMYYIMKKTSWGYDFKMTGQNEKFAKYGGVRTGKRMIIAMIVSGGLCGIAGAFEVFGIHYRFLQNISPGYAFDGMLVSMIVKNSPIGIMLMSVFFGGLKTGSISMENATSIPSELVLVIQSIIILFLAGEAGFKKKIEEIKMNRNKSKRAVKDSARSNI